MDVLEFIRLIRRHALLLMVVPIIMAVITYFLVRNTPAEYATSAMVYTGISTGTSIESMGETRRDQFVVNNSFENLINIIRSKETLREVGFRTLAIVLAKPTPELKEDARLQQKLQEWVPKEIQFRVVTPNNPEQTYQNLQRAYREDNQEVIKLLFNEGKTPFSLQTLESIKANRKGSSDMVDFSFTSNFPTLGQLTIQVLLDVFIKKYRELKSVESGNVVEYFQEKLVEIRKDLQDSEKTMQSFRENGNVINYGEQTKVLAIQKETISDEKSKIIGEMEASMSAIKAIEKKLSESQFLIEKNSELLQQKNKLIQLANDMVLSTGDLRNPQQQEENLLKQESLLRQEIQKLYDRSYTTENLDIKPLLQTWMEQLLQVEKNRVKAVVLDRRLKEINIDYSRFAPIGSNMERLSREISVHEQSYIQTLHDLNMALLKKQNIEISSKLNVVDRPTTVKLPGKKAMLIILAGVVGFVLVLSLLLAFELTDKTLRNPSRAERFLDMDLLGAMPDDTLKSHYTRQASYLLVNQFFSKVKIQQEKVRMVCITSNLVDEGKTYIGQKLVEKLRLDGLINPQVGQSSSQVGIFQKLSDFFKLDPNRVLWISSQGDDSPAGHADDYRYPETLPISELTDIAQLIPNQSIVLDDFTYLIIEIPPMILGNIPMSLLRKADYVVHVVGANRSWKKQDKKFLSLYEKNNIPFGILLNGVPWNSIENVLPESEVKEAKWKSYIKRLIRFEFNRKQWKRNGKKT